MAGIFCKHCGWVHDDYDCRPTNTPAPSEAIAQPSVEPVAWQHRACMYGKWSDWDDGRVPRWLTDSKIQYEERGLSPSTEVERLTRDNADLALRCHQLRERAETAEATNRSLEERLAEERAETVKVLEILVGSIRSALNDDDFRKMIVPQAVLDLDNAEDEGLDFLTKLKEGQP